MRLKVAISSPPDFSRFYERRIRKAVSETIQHLPRSLKKKLHGQLMSVSVALVGIQTIKNLNKKYRNKNSPTDVLSFSNLENDNPRTPEIHVGDLILCLPIAKKQAQAYQETLGRELERLTVHGTLHLFGYDHEKSKKDERIMFRFQDKILKRLSPKHLKT